MDNEQDPLMWMPADQAEMELLMRQLQRLIAHFNDTHPGHEIGQARIEINLPTHELTFGRYLIGDPHDE